MSNWNAIIADVTGMTPEPGPEFVERMDADVSGRLCDLVNDPGYFGRRAAGDWDRLIAEQARDEAELHTLGMRREVLLARMQKRGVVGEIEDLVAGEENMNAVRFDHTGIAENVLDAWGRR